MGYYTQKRAKRSKRRDELDAALITPHIWDWVNKHGGRSEHQGKQASDVRLMPINLLAHRMDCNRTVVERVLQDKTEWITFDKADRFLCAIGRPELWVTDPELHKIYEAVAKGADSISPIEDLAA